MADKGFDLKVLVPTDDGLTISMGGIEKARYFLMYNLSNRSYQLAGKIKTSDFYNNKTAESYVLDVFCNENKVDKIILRSETTVSFKTEVIHFTEIEIGVVLNQLIDHINEKELK